MNGAQEELKGYMTEYGSEFFICDSDLELLRNEEALREIIENIYLAGGGTKEVNTRIYNYIEQRLEKTISSYEGFEKLLRHFSYQGVHPNYVVRSYDEAGNFGVIGIIKDKSEVFLTLSDKCLYVDGDEEVCQLPMIEAECICA